MINDIKRKEHGGGMATLVTRDERDEGVLVMGVEGGGCVGGGGGGVEERVGGGDRVGGMCGLHILFSV